MYSENDLKNFWYAYKGGMKKHQLQKLLGITENESHLMLEAAKKLFGNIRRTNEEIPIERKAYFHHKPLPEKVKQPFVRPKAKYDNKSNEERIEEYLRMDV